MNCNDVRESLEMYIAGDLDAATSSDVAAHLAQCDECTAEYDSLRYLIGDLKDVGESFVPVERFKASEMVRPAIRPRAAWGWRLAAAAAIALAVVSTSALSVPAIAKQLPLPLGRELSALEEDNARLAEQVEQLKIEIRDIEGTEVPVVTDGTSVLPPEENEQVQALAMAFIRAQYAGDLDALAEMGTEKLKADLEARPDDYLRPDAGEVVFAQINDVAESEPGRYLVFVRLSDQGAFSDSQYQEDFEIIRAGDTFKVDFMGMDA